jgi:predicted acylesterase/phospholipase RssA
MGPPLPPQGTPVDGTVGPQPSPDFTPPKDGYVLVLGPGLARALSYIGVLREMEERNLPISAVVGVEMGAVIGAIWAGSNQNGLEWEMHKFKQDTLLDIPLLHFKNSVAEGKRLMKFLDDALKVGNLNKMRVPVVVVSAVRGGSDEGVLFENAGPAKETLRGAMGIPGILKTFTWEGKERLSAALENPLPVEQAKKLGLGRTVCVDALGRGDNFTPKEPVDEQLASIMRSVAAIARQERKDCDVALSIPADDIGYLDFDAKAELIYRGRAAVQKWQGK